MSGFHQINVSEQLAQRIESLSIAEIAELARLQAEDDIIGIFEAAAILKVHPNTLELRPELGASPISA